MLLRIFLMIFFALLGLKNEFIKTTIIPKTFVSSFLNKSEEEKSKGKTWKGNASFYHNKFEGRKTANGEIFSQTKMTCANNFLPLGTKIKVTNLSNGKIVFVKVNDRLAKSNKRLIDLSYLAAQKLGFVDKGIQKVEIEVMDKIILTETDEPIRNTDPIISTEEIKKVDSDYEIITPKKKNKKKGQVENSIIDDSLDLTKYNYIRK